MRGDEHPYECRVFFIFERVSVKIITAFSTSRMDEENREGLGRMGKERHGSEHTRQTDIQTDRQTELQNAGGGDRVPTSNFQAPAWMPGPYILRRGAQAAAAAAAVAMREKLPFGPDAD